MTINTFTKIPDNIINNKSGDVSDSSPDADTTPELSHRINSSFKEVTTLSPFPVEHCTQGQFLSHLFGSHMKAALVTNDLNNFELGQYGDARNTFGYFLPVAMSRGDKRRRNGDKTTLFDALKDGRFRYAAFEICTEDASQDFVAEVKSGTYPTAAIISIAPSTVQMLCRVDATSGDHYQDCCELILRVANDLMKGNRKAIQTTFCRLPSPGKGDLLYFNPRVQWHIPVLNNDLVQSVR